MKTLLKRLVIDTATDYLYLALIEGDNVLDYYYKKGKRDHSVNLMIEIDRIFKKRELRISDLDEIIVGIGPGSYTGLRIGVVVAKMFGWNNNIPVRTVSSLALIASSYQGSKLILAEIDARRGNSFLGVYKNNGKSLEIVNKEELTNLEKYKESLKEEFEVVSFGVPDIIKILNSSLLETVDDIHLLNPNYLRKTEAERNLENKR
jgi:tRNA threonylcarbamoyladenosine biosynthesis protein TsaB